LRRPRRVTLRSVLFHHIADQDSTFTAGLGVRMGVNDFRKRIGHLARWYHPVSIDEVRAAVAGAVLPPRSVLLTFDDAYASVAEKAAPVLEEYRVPSVFFVNGGFIDHEEMNIDNLVAHTANTSGVAAIERAIAEVRPDGDLATLSGVLDRLVPTLRLAEVHALRDTLFAELDHDPRERAAAEGLYLTGEQLTSLSLSMAIGSHTRSHVRCRNLDHVELLAQIDGNRRLLADAVGTAVGSFSVPYGSALDFPAPVAAAVRNAGHDLSFLVEGQLNHGPLVADRILRVSLAKTSTLGSTVELEVLPRLRRVRDLIRGGLT
jgi:peptidoglycan/xylan/chitin deacetylase (PgdA/CDA1 family)